ncbi:MAG: uracil-DNA glycosylase [Eubacteriales bacterium]|jgi:DNA polymerase
MYDLNQLNSICSKCNRCRLHENRTNIVFGEGNPQTDLMFVGEGPGSNEDRLGRPFVGKAGHLLDKMLKAIDLTRDEIYITNIVKCRPPGNRNPEESEIEKCLPYLRWQVKIIKPKIIVSLGSISAKVLINEDIKITKDRGRIFTKGKIKFIPTLHPAYLLRNPNAKKDSWEDFKLISKTLKELRSR